MKFSDLCSLCLLLLNSDADPYDQPLHTLIFRVLRAADPHAVSVSPRHREHDGRAGLDLEGGPEPQLSFWQPAENP